MKSLLNHARDTWRRDDGDHQPPLLIRDGLLVNSSDVWVWLRIPEGSTYLLEDSEVGQVTASLTQSLRTVLPAGAEYHLKIMWTDVDPQDYVESWNRFASYRAPGIADYIDHGRYRIALNSERGALRQRVAMLGLRWPAGRADSVGRQARRALRDQRGDHRDAAQRAEAVQGRIDDWIEQMAASPLRAQRAPAGLIAWSWGREWRRGAQPAVPGGAEFSGARTAALGAGEIDPNDSPNYTVVTDARTGAQRYVTVLVPAVNGFPADDLAIPGGEWLEILAEVPGTEASVRGVMHSAETALGMINDATKLSRSQGEEAAEGGMAAEQEVYDAADVLRERRGEIIRREDAETTNHPRWIVDAGDPGELQRRVDALVQRYTGVVELVNAPYVQDLLVQEILPGDRIRVPEFGQDQPLRTLVGSWFHGGSLVGDTTGPYIGTNLGTSKLPVQLHLTSAAPEHRGQTTTVTVTGRSGVGKSTAAVLMGLGVLSDGAWMMLLDAKGDLAGICDVAPRLLGVPVSRVNILDPECSGLMDPMRFAHGLDEARSLALSALTGVLNADDRGRAETVLEAAIEQVLRREREFWSCPAVIEVLRTAPETDPQAETARRIGETLSHRARLASARPVLGDLHPDAARGRLLVGRGLVYMDLSHLDLPRHSADPQHWQIPERCGIATYRMTMAYALHQSRHYQGIPKWVCLTELHLLTGYPEGRGFVEWIARAGRALKLGQILDTQSAEDLAGIPGLIEQILVSLVFAADSEAEQAAQAVLAHRPGHRPRLHAAQAGLGVGEALMRDRYNRIAPVEFDRLTTWIAEQLDTNADADDPATATYDQHQNGVNA